MEIHPQQIEQLPNIFEEPKEAHSISKKGLETSNLNGAFNNHTISLATSEAQKTVLKNKKYLPSDIRHYAPPPPLTEQQIRLKNFVPFQKAIEENPNLHPSKIVNRKRNFASFAPGTSHANLLKGPIAVHSTQEEEPTLLDPLIPDRPTQNKSKKEKKV
jgi:hypothetical protein